MGNRANIVVVEHGDWRLYYSHWAGCRMLDLLIGGPEHALRYVQTLRSCAKDDWCEPLWADGGAVIDYDRNRLRFFGEELLVGMNERRAMLKALPAVWPGWRVDVAHDGTMELVEYVSAEVRRYEPGDFPRPKRARGMRDQLCQVVSVVDADGALRLWPLWYGDSAAWRGPALLHVLPGRGVIRTTRGVIPAGGVHVDAARKTVGVWQTADCMGIVQALPRRWPGWQIEYWYDRFEEQLSRCGTALRIPELDVAGGVDRALDWLHRRVFQSFEDSPAGQTVKLAGMLAPLNPGLEVSADAVSHGGIRPTEREWARFVAACESVRERWVAGDCLSYARRRPTRTAAVEGRR